MNWRPSSRRIAVKASRLTREAKPVGPPESDSDAAEGAANKSVPEPQESPRYGRAQFLRDAVSMGVDADRAFSRSELRRRRDQLMNTHHPDRGGADDVAVRINETYSRMVGWLDHRRFRRDDRKPRKMEMRPEGQADDWSRLYRSALTATARIGAIQLTALALMAVAGYQAFRRRRP